MSLTVLLDWWKFYGGDKELRWNKNRLFTGSYVGYLDSAPPPRSNFPVRFPFRFKMIYIFFSLSVVAEMHPLIPERALIFQANPAA